MVTSAVTPLSRAMRRFAWLRWLAIFAVAAALATGISSVAAQPPPPTQPSDDIDHGGHGGDGVSREPTPEERAAADDLVTKTKAAAARFAEVRAAQADGYVQITPFSFYGVRAAHFGNPAYQEDGRVLDVERPENLVYLRHDDGRLELIGVMYLAPIGQGPAVGGPLTEWHIHDDLCASRVPLLSCRSCQPAPAHLARVRSATRCCTSGPSSIRMARSLTFHRVAAPWVL